jgi:Cu/Ag efflux protein CusF
MTIYSKIFARLAVVSLAVLSTPIQAADEWVNATVKRIERDQLKITLQHEEIKSLEMPAMRMVFRVDSLVLLDGIAIGDVVKFTAVQRGGSYLVTNIRKSP